jgi:hypothetical protein
MYECTCKTKRSANVEHDKAITSPGLKLGETRACAIQTARSSFAGRSATQLGFLQFKSNLGSDSVSAISH